MFDGQSISDWLTNNILVIAVVVIGIGIIVKANSGETRKAITTAGIVMIGLLIVAAAPRTEEIGNWLYGLVS